MCSASLREDRATRSATQAFENALLAKAPVCSEPPLEFRTIADPFVQVDLQATANTIIAALDAAFANATAAYAQF